MTADSIEVERRLYRWHPAARLDERLGGGNRNDIWAVRLGERRLAARLSRRELPANRWEVALLRYLRDLDFRVPNVVRSARGEQVVDGLVVFSWLDGEPPATDADWWRVVATLRRLHGATADWPQRPGFHSSRDLLVEARGGDVDLGTMPAEAREAVRTAWRAIADEPHSVVHGDPGPGNIRIYRGTVGLIDWDEARVDASMLDLAAVPVDVAPLLGAKRLARVRRAADAWEAANGWIVEPAYARRRLARLTPP